MMKLPLHDKPFFTIRISKTCEHWVKRTYTMQKCSNKALIAHLQQFGKLSVLDFSEFQPLAKMCFFIKSDTEIRIAGTENDENIELTMKVDSPYIVSRFEQILLDWIQYK